MTRDAKSPSTGQGQTFRVKRRSHFTMVANETVRSPELSLKAKGLLLVMLSHSEEWHYHVHQITTLSKDGRDGHYSALTELIKAGYVVRVSKERDEGKFSGTDLVVSDDILTVSGFSVSGKTVSGKSDTKKNNPKKTNSKKNNLTTGTANSSFELPPFVDTKTWADFEQHRKELGKKLTPTSVKNLVAKLEKAHADGHDVNALIINAISNGWQGIWIPKSAGQQKSSGRGGVRRGADERVRDNAQAVYDALNRGGE